MLILQIYELVANGKVFCTKSDIFDALNLNIKLMETLNMIFLAVAFCTIPAGVLWLCRKIKFLGKIGPVLILYMAGLIIGNIGIMPDQLQKGRYKIADSCNDYRYDFRRTCRDHRISDIRSEY